MQGSMIWFHPIIRSHESHEVMFGVNFTLTLCKGVEAMSARRESVGMIELIFFPAITLPLSSHNTYKTVGRAIPIRCMLEPLQQERGIDEMGVQSDRTVGERDLMNVDINADGPHLGTVGERDLMNVDINADGPHLGMVGERDLMNVDTSQMDID
ncbi:hypothetical protein BDR03DRAFT_987205 [Suillus americanus]|nr:hypothetical protein BDR03DRAFT_987205 [Suillus americanus]